MAILRTDAVVLKTVRFGDTSAIFRMFTRSEGVIPVMARGVRRPKSKFAGLIEPFRVLSVTIHTRESREVQTLSNVEVLAHFPAVYDSLERMEVAGAWFRLLRAVLPDGARADAVFDLVPMALDRLARTPAEQAPRWEAFHRAAALAALGVQPELFNCVSCGREVGGTEPPAFSISDGGALCGSCASTSGDARFLDRGVYALLNLYTQPDYTLIEALDARSRGDRGARRLLGDFVRYHADPRTRSG